MNLYYVRGFFEYFKCFQDGQEDIEDDVRSEHISRQQWRNFYIVMGLCSFIVFLKVKLSVNIAILKSLLNSVKKNYKKKKRKRSELWKNRSASRQLSGLHCIVCKAVSSQI